MASTFPLAISLLPSAGERFVFVNRVFCVLNVASVCETAGGIAYESVTYFVSGEQVQHGGTHLDSCLAVVVRYFKENSECDSRHISGRQRTREENGTWLNKRASARRRLE